MNLPLCFKELLKRLILSRQGLQFFVYFLAHVSLQFTCRGAESALDTSEIFPSFSPINSSRTLGLLLLRLAFNETFPYLDPFLVMCLLYGDLFS
jgi:hypothetical protein